MKDSVCVITGGTDGIGKAAAYGYVDCKLTPPSSAAEDDAAAERLWQVSEQLVGIARG